MECGVVGFSDGELLLIHRRTRTMAIRVWLLNMKSFATIPAAVIGKILTTALLWNKEDLMAPRTWDWMVLMIALCKV